MNKSGREIYPAAVLRKIAILPGEKISLILEEKEMVDAVKIASQDDHSIVFAFKKNGEMSRIATKSRIIQFWHLSPSIIGIAIEGLERVELFRLFEEKEIKKAEIEPIKVKVEETTELEALSRSVFDQLKKLIQIEGIIPLLIVSEIQKDHIPAGRMSDLIASAIRLDFPEKLELLETTDVKKRLEILNEKLAKELNVAETEQKIQHEVEKKMTKEQREFILKEQLQAIQKELGITKEEEEYSELERKIKKVKMSETAEKKALKELSRLRAMSTLSAEAPYIRAYLDWMAELPWSQKSKTVIDFKKAKKILDEDHYGLLKTKERILEYLAVQKLTKGKGRGTIMCFVGPPGTGKTSVGKSIARALGRKFVRISLGGIRDEAEIRGHRRTYVGALPGRIIQGMKTAETKNPVFMLDEIDKIGADFRGDPGAALLEVLDQEQNYAFSDHYLETPFDLSEVIFITTANILDPVPPALRDRMEIIEFPGYTDEEKFHIAKKFLLPRALSSSGLDEKRLLINDEVIKKIIGKYTREAGVRNLERQLLKIARKAAKKIAEGTAKEKISVRETNLFDYLGPEEFKITMSEEKDEIGAATGLAWTPAGGEIIIIETILMPGKGNLILTGQLGEIMQESAKAALSYIRSKSHELKFEKDFYRKNDIHIHVPSGAIPKDGPSAGIAIAAALASTLTKRKVKKEIALTGEITLSGKILEIGGIKEKALAAHRAGVKTMILPKENEKNLADIPDEARRELKFKFVKHMDEVLKIILK
ncbi:MAG: endopeptidase La [Parcubacteria group bacterium]|nr:endopeptidase La [Parcubacteria group bacterium]MCR4342934.1 endopeptidase La [Patescibacteria group bacterium]